MAATIINDPRHPAAVVARVVLALAHLNIVVQAPGLPSARLPVHKLIEGLEAFLPPGGLLLVGEALANDLAHGITITLPDGLSLRVQK
jgi:hypothetical protein